MIWIDTHAHVSSVGLDGQRRVNLLGELLAVLEREKADLRLVISPDGAELEEIACAPEGQTHAAEFIHRLVEQASGRLYGACCVNPHYVDEALCTMDLCFGAWGFVLLGEILQYILDFRLASAEMERIVRHALQYDVPVQIHISTSNSAQGSFASGLEELDDFCRLYEREPEAKYILAHFVGMDKQPAVVDLYLDEIERRWGCFPSNVWAEIRDFNSPGVRSALTRIPHDRLLAGTDWLTRLGPPFPPYGVLFMHTAENNPYPPCVATLVEFLGQVGANGASISRIAYENAVALLRLQL